MNRNLRRFIFWLIVLLPLVALSYCYADFSGLIDHCDYVLLQRELSPDWRWRADVTEAICPVGFFSTDVGNYLTVSEAADAKRKSDILGVDTGGNKNERIRFHWSANDVLTVNLPSIEYLKVLTLHFEGVHIDLHAEGFPDDPKSRAVRFDWERKRGLPTF